MKKTKLFNRTGFTLMELLIVMAIVIALMAILVPALMSNQKKARINQAKLGVSNLEKALELYSTENRGYPTTEQGLYMLFYIPDQLAVAPTLTGMNPTGMTPDMMMSGADPSAQFSGGAGSVGGPGMPPGGGMMSPGGLGGTIPSPMAPTPGGVGFDTMGTMGVDPTSGMPGSGMPGDMTGAGGSLTGWTQPVHNPQLYTMKKLRSVPYLDSEDSLKDPWGTPYRYDNSMMYYGLNKTGDAKPAIWSAGPDKQDDTDDDLRNWDPVEAQTKIAQRQQMGVGNGGIGTGTDMFGNPQNMMGNGTNPADPFAQPTMPQPGVGMPNPAIPQPGTGMPNPVMPQPGVGMPNPAMPQPGTGMPAPPVLPPT